MKICSAEGCDLEHVARGFCARHYNAEKRSGRLLNVVKSEKICSDPGCGKPCRRNGLCNTHSNRLRVRGTTAKRERQKPVCSVPGCLETHKFAKGYCGRHYMNLWRHGDPLWAGVPENHCSIEGCKEEYRGRGYYARHYKSWYDYGDPLASETKRLAPFRWLLDNLDYKDDDCLIWPFRRGNHNYGEISIDKKDELAHVVMCTIAHGPKPESLYVARHLCGNGHLGCCAPNHVVWGTRSQNQLDRVEHGTDIRGENHPLVILSNIDVLDIAALIYDGVPIKEIAREYNISTGAIYSIKRGNTWGWLTGFPNPSPHESKD